MDLQITCALDVQKREKVLSCFPMNGYLVVTHSFGLNVFFVFFLQQCNIQLGTHRSFMPSGVIVIMSFHVRSTYHLNTSPGCI